VRDEAERLVAAAIAAISSTVRAGQAGARGAGTRPGFATGSAECCVCPVCRAIAAMREPAPEFADRLAAGVSDLASSVAAVLRMLQRPAHETPTQRTPESDGDEFWESLRRKAADAAKAAARTVSTVDPAADHEDPWRAATAEPAPPSAPPATAAPAPQPAAPVKKAMARKAVKKAAPAQASASAQAPVSVPAPAPAQVARKAAPAKATPVKTAPAKAAPAKAAKKAAPRRARGSEA